MECIGVPSKHSEFLLNVAWLSLSFFSALALFSFLVRTLPAMLNTTKTSRNKCKFFFKILPYTLSFGMIGAAGIYRVAVGDVYVFDDAFLAIAVGNFFFCANLSGILVLVRFDNYHQKMAQSEGLSIRKTNKIVLFILALLPGIGMISQVADRHSCALIKFGISLIAVAAVGFMLQTHFLIHKAIIDLERMLELNFSNMEDSVVYKTWKSMKMLRLGSFVSYSFAVTMSMGSILLPNLVQILVPLFISLCILMGAFVSITTKRKKNTFWTKTKVQPSHRSTCNPGNLDK